MSLEFKKKDSVHGTYWRVTWNGARAALIVPVWIDEFTLVRTRETGYEILSREKSLEAAKEWFEAKAKEKK